MNLLHDSHLQLDMLHQLAQKPPLFAPSPSRFWDDPHVAQQMLKAHLDPNTDAASRKPETIDRTVAWIMAQTGLQPGAALLDLGCGPGLYTRRFAECGLRVTGVDLSENSIRYAREHDSLTTYSHNNYVYLIDVNAYDAAVLIYGDFNVLSDSDRDTVLGNVRRALRPGGHFIFDVSTPPHYVHSRGKQEWGVSLEGGFWKAGPHLTLYRSHDYGEHDTGLDQYVVVEESGDVSEFRVWNHYYTAETIRPIVEAQGFAITGLFADLMGAPYHPDSEWIGIVARVAQSRN